MSADNYRPMAFDHHRKDPVTWTPRPGDELVGTVLEVAYVPSDYGDQPVTVLTLADADRRGHHRVWCSRVSLREQVVQIQPHPGDCLRLSYLGVREPEGKRPWHEYRVRRTTCTQAAA